MSRRKASTSQSQSQSTENPTSHLSSKEIRTLFSECDDGLSMKCRNCDKKYSKNAGIISNLRRHVGRYHKELLGGFVAASVVVGSVSNSGSPYIPPPIPVVDAMITPKIEEANIDLTCGIEIPLGENVTLRGEDPIEPLLDYIFKFLNVPETEIENIKTSFRSNWISTIISLRNAPTELWEKLNLPPPLEQLIKQQLGIFNQSNSEPLHIPNTQDLPGLVKRKTPDSPSPELKELSNVSKRPRTIRRLVVARNGQALAEGYFLVIPSFDCALIVNEIDESGHSKAYYLAGAEATGKTNTLWQINLLAKKKGYKSVFIDGDLNFKENKWEEVEEGLMDLDFVRDYVSSKPRQEGVLRRVMNCVRAFNELKNPSVSNLRDVKVVVCIDESHNFINEDKEIWFQFIKELIRHRPNTWVITANSTFDFLIANETEGDSPFERRYYQTTYFTKEQIRYALLNLQGEEHYFLDLPGMLDRMIEKIHNETQGHPCLCSFYFDIIRDIFNRISQIDYPIALSALPLEWDYGSSVKILMELEFFKLKFKIANQIKLLAGNLEASGLLYDFIVKYDKSLPWHNHLISIGLTKLEGENMALSCNIMRRFYLEVLAEQVIPRPNFNITNFCLPYDSLDILAIVIYIFEQIHHNFVQTEEGNQRKMFNASSVKAYQTLFFGYLSVMCKPPWYPLLDVCFLQKDKLDLGVMYSPNKATKKKYLIEIVLVQEKVGEKGPSADNHYLNQLQKLNQGEISGAVVVVVFAHKYDSYAWPQNQTDPIKYLVVEHLTSADPKQLTIKINEETSLRIEKNQ